MSTSTLWYTRCPAPTAASVAIRNGWLVDEFAADGIEVLSLAASTDKTVQLSHYRHSQPNSFRFGGYVPPLVAASRGADIKIIGLSAPDRKAGIYALLTSDIRTPEDLRGKRFSLPVRVNDSTDWWRATVLKGYETGLKRAGLSLSDIELVEVRIDREYIADATQGAGQGQSLWGARSQFAVQREEITALQRGEVDVVYSDAAMAALVIAFAGLRTIVDLSASESGLAPESGFPSVLTVSGGLLRERPDLVTRWVSRLLNAKAWGQKNEAEAKRIIANDTGLPVDFVDDAYSPSVHAQLDVDLSPVRLAQLRLRYDHLLANGFLEEAIDFDLLVDPLPLKRALAEKAGGSPAPAAETVGP